MLSGKTKIVSEKRIRKGFVLSRISTEPGKESRRYLALGHEWTSLNKAHLLPTAYVTMIGSTPFIPGYNYTIFPAEQTKDTTTYISLTEEN